MDMRQDEPGLLSQHAQVLFDTDTDGRLVGVNEPDGEAPPRLFVARGRAAVRMWCRSDLGPAAIERCLSLQPKLPLWDGNDTSSVWYGALRSALGTDAPVADDERGPAFRFLPAATAQDASSEAVLVDESSAELLERFFPRTRAMLASRAPIAGVVRDGVVVSACYSARKRPFACEAGVATAESFRGLGLATAAVRAWRRAVEGAGAMPFYSTTWDNGASLRIASKLGLVAYADTVSLA